MANIIERFINIFVDSGDAERKLKGLDTGIKKVDDSTTRITQTTNKSTKAFQDNRKSIIDNGGAMGLLSEITGGIAMTFKDAAEAIELTGMSMKSLNGILAASVIGAVVLAVGALAANWEEVSNWIGLSNKNLEDYIKLREKANSEIIKRQTSLSAAVDALNSALKENIKDSDKIEAAFNRLVSIIPELKNFKITNPEDLKTVTEIVDNMSKLVYWQEMAKADTEALTTLREDLRKKGIEEIKLTEEQFNAAKKLKDATGDESLKLSQRFEIQKKLEGILGDEYEKQLEINERRLNLNTILDKEAFYQGEVNRLVGTKVKLTEQENKLNDEKKKQYDELLNLEKQRLSQIKAIREQIEKEVVAKKKSIDISDSDRQALALNDQFKAITDLYNKQTEYNSLLETAKRIKDEAFANKKIEAEQNREIERIEKLISANEKLIQKQAESILVDPMADSSVSKRLEIIKANGDAEIMSIRGRSYEALAIRKWAFNEEAKLREKSLSDSNESAKKLYESSLNEFNEVRDKKGTEEYDKAKAKLNDFYKAYLQTESAYREESTNNNAIFNAMTLQQEQELLFQKIELQQQYADNVLSISSNLQGLLGVLQDESLIRDEGFRKTMLILEKGLAIADVWINEARSSAQAKFNAAQVPKFISFPNGLSVPNPAKPIAIASATAQVATNKINAGIATAAILAQTIASLSPRSSGGGAGSAAGGGGGPQAQFNIVGSSGTNQLAAAIGAQQQQPVNAYVVGSDVTTQQALDRNRVTNATFL